MDPRFENTYQVLFDDYKGNNYLTSLEYRRTKGVPYVQDVKTLALLEDWVDVIKRAILAAMSDNDYNHKLRADARYFLLLNFHNLIVRPLINDETILLEMETISEREGNYIGLANNNAIELLKYQIFIDIKSIIQYTIRTKQAGSEVSGHDIMSAIDLGWRELILTQLNIWG